MDVPLNLEYLRAIGNPAKRYRFVREAEGLLKRELAMIARNAVAEMQEHGMSTMEVARELGISHQRVAQLRREPHYEPSPGDKPLGRPKASPTGDAA